MINTAALLADAAKAPLAEELLSGRQKREREYDELFKVVEQLRTNRGYNLTEAAEWVFNHDKTEFEGGRPNYDAFYRAMARRAKR